MKAAVGASGGVNIIAGTIEVYLNYFFLKRDPLSAVLAPRIYHQVCYFFFFFFSSQHRKTLLFSTYSIL